VIARIIFREVREDGLGEEAVEEGKLQRKSNYHNSNAFETWTVEERGGGKGTSCFSLDCGKAEKSRKRFGEKG